MNQSNPVSTPEKPGRLVAAPLRLRWLIVAWSLLLVYLVIFFWANPSHWVVGWLVLIPDEIVLQWTGHDWSRIFLLDRFPLLLMVAGICFSAIGSGRLLLRPSGLLKELSRDEGILFSLAVGLSCLSLCTLALGWAGLLQQPALFIGLLVLPVLVEVICLKCFPAVRPKGSQEAKRSAKLDRRSPNWSWLICPLLLIVLLGSMLPPQDLDVREYHLQVPKEWYQAGRIDFLPHNVYGNMPLGAEVLSIPAMAVWPGEDGWWWGAMVGKSMMAVFGLLTAWALYLFGRRWFSGSVGIVAAIIFLGTPWVLQICLNGLVEMAVAFYGLMAVYATFLWRQHPQRLAWPAVAGFLAGSAVACKYPAVLLVVLPLLLYLSVYAGRRAPQVLLVFIVAVAMGCGLWFAKNYVQTGNPAYPLGGKWLGKQTRSVTRYQDWKRVHQVPLEDGRRYSLRQFWNSLSQFAGRSAWQSPLLIPLALLGLIWGRRHPEVLWVAALIAYSFLTWWLLTHRIERFWVPMLPLVAMLAGLGSVQLCRSGPRVALPGILLFATLFGTLVGSSSLLGDNRFLVALQQLREGPAVDTIHAHVHRHLNKIVPSDSGKVLLVGDVEPFDLRIPVLYNTCFDDCLFEQLLRNRTSSERLDALREQGITHVFIYWKGIERYREPGNYGFTNYVTRDLVQKELVDEEILHRLDLPSPGMPQEVGELFEVGHAVKSAALGPETSQEEP